MVERSKTKLVVLCCVMSWWVVATLSYQAGVYSTSSSNNHSPAKPQHHNHSLQNPQGHTSIIGEYDCGVLGHTYT